MADNIPVITIDGPSGAGKGTVSKIIADRLGWHFLDSGAIYRVLALASLHHDIASDDEESLAQLSSCLDVHFKSSDVGASILVILEGEDVTTTIRNEKVGAVASKIASLPTVRDALLLRQRAFRALPGLVADGRDMGTVVFKNANIKVFLNASAEERAKRRYLQLKDNDPSVKITHLLTDIKARDERDRNRSVAPLVPAEDALIIDSTDLSVEQVVDCIFNYMQDKFN